MYIEFKNPDILKAFKKPIECKTFLYLILHVDKESNIELSLNKLSFEIGRKQDTTCKTLKKLEEEQFISKKLHKKHILIHVLPNEAFSISGVETHDKDTKKENESKKTPVKSFNKNLEDFTDAEFNEWLKSRFPYVARMDKTLTLAEAKKLKEKYLFQQVITILMKMNNYKPLLEHNRNAYQTILSWMKNEH